MNSILDNLPDKTEYKNTTSLRFKKDLIEFFKDKDLNVCLEIGTNHGHTTHVLSYLFKHVFTIDHLQSNTDTAKEVNKERTNITYITGDAYKKETYTNIPKIDVAFIDCIHTHSAVLKDIQTALDLCSSEGIYLIFDDYGHPLSKGVHTAVQEGIKEGLTEVCTIGEKIGFTFTSDQPRTLIHDEGIILSYGK